MTSVLSRLSEASATSLMCSGRLSSPACLPVSGSNVEPELGGDHHLLAEGRQRFAHEFFVGERAVDFGGVEERDAEFDGRPDQGDHLLLVFGRTVAEAHSHAAEPDGRNFQVALSKFALLHFFSFEGLFLSFHRLRRSREFQLLPLATLVFLYSLIGTCCAFITSSRASTVGGDGL